MNKQFGPIFYSLLLVVTYFITWVNGIEHLTEDQHTDCKILLHVNDIVLETPPVIDIVSIAYFKYNYSYLEDVYQVYKTQILSIRNKSPPVV